MAIQNTITDIITMMDIGTAAITTTINQSASNPRFDTGRDPLPAKAALTFDVRSSELDV